MLAPVSKGHSRLDGEGAGREIHALIDLAMGAPPGPVHVELSWRSGARVCSRGGFAGRVGAAGFGQSLHCVTPNVA